MGSLTKRQKAAKARQLPDYIPTDDEFRAYQYCVRRDIRISPIGILGEAGKWYIGVSTPDSYKKVYNSPHIYDRDTVWHGFYEMCNYYYKKK